jgi:hypothetical protein
MAKLPKVLINRADYQIGGCCTSAQNSGSARLHAVHAVSAARPGSTLGEKCIVQAGSVARELFEKTGLSVSIGICKVEPSYRT